MFKWKEGRKVFNVFEDLSHSYANVMAITGEEKKKKLEVQLLA